MALFKRSQKPAIVLVHGFGKKVSHEFDKLKPWLEKRGYPVTSFDIYNPKDPADCDWHTWIARCEQALKQTMAVHEHVIVLGFSMGGVISSYLASIYDIDSLILLAPAFQYLDLSSIPKAGKSLLSSPSADTAEEAGPGSEQTRAFMDIVANHKESIAHVNCPVFILHGLDDEIIPVKSSIRALEKIPHNKKRLLLLGQAKHRMAYDGMMEESVYTLIENWLEGKMLPQS